MLTMKMKSAWSRGLLYGSIFGGAIAIFPILAALFGQAPLGEAAFAGGLVALIWGTLGFLAGVASHSEQPAETPGESVPSVQISVAKRMLYRFIAGLLLSYIAGAVVCAIGMGIYSVWQGDLFAMAVRRRTQEEFLVIFIGLCGMVGAETGAIAGCWLGALLSPGGNQLAPVARAALPSAILGALSGGWFGAIAGFLKLQFPSQEAVVIVVAVVVGAIGGIGSAVVTRLGGFHWHHRQGEH